MSGCLNPVFFDHVDPDVDHAPVLIGLTPEPNVDLAGKFGPLLVQVGENCAPQTTFAAQRLEDADFDTLTVRLSLSFGSGPNNTPTRQSARDSEIVPLDPPVDGVVYDFQPFQLDHFTVNRIILDPVLKDQVEQHKAQGQLLELRISDGGFKSGTDEPPEGSRMAFASWPIVLDDQPCGTP